MPVEYLTPAIEARAGKVQLLLADRGQHRAPGMPDLVVAATAKPARLTVVHLDKDFELITGVTGQPTEWLSTQARASPHALIQAGEPDAVEFRRRSTDQVQDRGRPTQRIQTSASKAPARYLPARSRSSTWARAHS